MLLTAALEPQEKDLTLDADAARFGVGIRGRHTALGDALVTADIMQRLIPRMEAAGIYTLEEARALCRRPKRLVAAQRKAGWLCELPRAAYSQAERYSTWPWRPRPKKVCMPLRN